MFKCPQLKNEDNTTTKLMTIKVICKSPSQVTRSAKTNQIHIVPFNAKLLEIDLKTQQKWLFRASLIG